MNGPVDIVIWIAFLLTCVQVGRSKKMMSQIGWTGVACVLLILAVLAYLSVHRLAG